MDRDLQPAGIPRGQLPDRGMPFQQLPADIRRRHPTIHGPGEASAEDSNELRGWRNGGGRRLGLIGQPSLPGGQLVRQVALHRPQDLVDWIELLARNGNHTAAFAQAQQPLRGVAVDLGLGFGSSSSSSNGNSR